MAKSKRTPIPEELKPLIIKYALEGRSPGQIVEQLPPGAVTYRQVQGYLTLNPDAKAAGIISTTRAMPKPSLEQAPGSLPSPTPAGDPMRNPAQPGSNPEVAIASSPLPSGASMFPTAAPASSPFQPRPLVLPPPSDFAWGAQSTNLTASGGVPYGHGETRIDVERIVPADGMLGRHTSLTKDELGRMYGQGTYTLTRYEPNKYPMTATIIISENYGQRRFPNREEANQQIPNGGGAPGGGGYRGYYTTQGASHPQEGASQVVKSVIDGAEKIMQMGKGSDQGTAAALTEAIKTLGAPRPDQSEAIRTYFLEEAKRRDQEKKDDAERRRLEKADEDERRRKDSTESDKRWERWMEMQRIQAVQLEKEREAAHGRELERIRIDAQARDKFEDRKLENLKTHYDAQIELADKKIEEQDKSIDARMKEMELQRDKDRKHDGETLKLQQAQLDQQKKYEGQLIDIQKKQAESQTMEKLVVGTLQNVINKIDTRLQSHDDLKRIELLHAAASREGVTVEEYVARHGNIAPGSAVPVAKPAEGDSPRRTRTEDQMGMMERYFQTPEFQEIAAELAGQIQKNRGPQTFANTLLTWMGAEHLPELKTAATTFQFFMDRRDWPEMLEAMRPHIANKKTLEAFDLPNAGKLYEGFRGIVSVALQRHYEALVENAPAAPAPTEEAKA